MTSDEHHRGGTSHRWIHMLRVGFPNTPRNPSPPLLPPPPQPATHSHIVQAGGGGACGVAGGSSGGPEILLSSRRPCFNVSQDDEIFFLFHFLPALVFMGRRMTIKFWGGVRWGGSGGGWIGWGVLSGPRTGWPLSCVGCVLAVSGFSSGDLSVLWIGRGTVGRWPWACAGGFQ